MLSIKRGSIFRHSLMLGVVPACIAFTVLLFLFTQLRLDDAKEALNYQGQQLANQLAPACEYGVISGNREMLSKIVSRTFDLPEVIHVRITDILGDTLAERTRTQINAEAKGNHVYAFTSSIQREIVNLSNSDEEFSWNPSSLELDASDNIIGTVEVKLNDQRLIQQQQQILFQSAIAVILFLAILLLLAIRLARSVSDPVSTLNKAVRKIRKGNYSVSIDVHSNNELNQLAKGIGIMARELGETKIAWEKTIEKLDVSREEAVKANKAKSDFLAMMSHELRTPINGVYGMLQLLESTSLDKEQSDYVQTGIHSVRHLTTIINDILDFSRIEQGTFLIDSNPVDIKALINSCYDSFKHEATCKGIQLNVSYEEKIKNKEICGDATRIKQILLNLLTNAIKFTNAGHVDVFAVLEKSEFENEAVLFLQVNDTGVGIAESQLPSIFNAFEQLDKSDSRLYGGTGLGLAMVKKLVDLMGGDIHVSSEVTQGTSMSVHLPLKYRDAQSPNKKEMPTRQLFNQTPCCLLVEDNVVNQKVVASMLKQFGADVHIASNGQQAIDLFTSRKFDIVFMDCQMPVMDGFEATQKIRQYEINNSQEKTPVIAITANVMEGTRQQCLDAGMDAYISKPVKKEVLEESLVHWMCNQVD